MKRGVRNAFTGQTAQRFADYADTVRGFVRYQLVRQNLQAYLKQKPLAIADIGGGAAIDAVWLAELGHSVTIVEPAADQLALAKGKLSQLEPAVAARIATVQGTVETLLANGKAGTYDVVLSHGVAMYIDDPQPFIASLNRLLKLAGILSLLEKGWAGAYSRVVSDQDYAAANRLQREDKFANHMGKLVWAFRPDVLQGYLTASGFKTMEWKGVRVAHDTDYRPTATLEQEGLHSVLAVEQAFGTAHETRGMGQMLHFIAQKYG